MLSDIFRKSVVVLHIAMSCCMLLGCGRGTESPPVRLDEPSADAVPDEPISIEISPEQMMSDTERGDISRATLEKTNALAVPVSLVENNGSGKKSSTAASRVLYRYVQPLQMISESELRDVEKNAIAVNDVAREEDDSRLSDMVALSYVNKSTMLSIRTGTGRHDTSLREQQDAGPGFILEHEFYVHDALAHNEPVAVSSDNPDAVQQAVYFVREAEGKIRAGELEAAETFFAKALALFPDTTYVNKRLGQISLSRGEYEKAVRYFKAALDTDEGMAEALNELGIAHLYAGDSEEALQNFVAAHSADPEFIEPVYNAGLALRRLGRVKEAQININEFLVQEPGDARGYRELAMLYVLETNNTAALEELERAMLLDDKWGMPYLDAAAIYNDMAEYVRVVNMLDQALERSSAIRIYHLYKSLEFSEVRLIPESRPFEARLSDKLRTLL